MNVTTFIKKVKKQDSRNRFERLTHIEFNHVPPQLKEFYLQANPVDVEIQQVDLTSIKFFPVESLEAIQEEYGLDKDSFIFAAREGDPILFKEGKIYIAIHGAGEWIPEEVADSFEAFLAMIVE